MKAKVASLGLQVFWLPVLCLIPNYLLKPLEMSSNFNREWPRRSMTWLWEASHSGTASCLQEAMIPDYFLAEFETIKSIYSGG